LITSFDPGILWDDFGVRSDVVVCLPIAQMKIKFSNSILQPFTSEFPRADIHELLSPDLLHQLIKGTFKDHLVTWVNEYLIQEHGTARGTEIIDDIDRRYVPFICLLNR
jgi:Plavaka transposase